MVASASSSSSTHQYTFEAPELSTNHVTVYADRAEVKKVIRAKLNAGVNEIVVKKLTKSIESDSIRVEGFGKSVICEVKYQEKHVKKEEDIKQNEKDLYDKLNALGDEKSKIDQQLQRLKKQREVLEGVATQIGSARSNDGNDKKEKTSSGLALISDVSFDNLEKFFTFYNERAGNIDDQSNAVRQKSEKLVEEINVVEKNLQDVRSDDNFMSREVSIIVKADEPELAELHVSYLVSNASWTPSYDLRVSTKESLIQVNYYGLIQQNTNEDWNDVEMSLSTAMPRIGGQIPELKTLKIGFYNHQESAPRRSSYAARVKAKSRKIMSMESMRKSFSNALSLDEESERMDLEVTEVRDSVISTSFDIVHPTTIPSDNTSHKVTVAIVDLKPSFQYESVPAKSTFAYLKAKIVNTSTYPFLPGPTSVFLDNNFVAKSSLKAVSPSEEFFCSLGVDPAVRVEYKPVRKFHEETGLLSKSSVVTHEQKIDVKNTKAEPVKITVIDSLPLSSEEKVKVNLIEPNVNNKTEKGVSVKINKLNNVEFELIIPKNETRELVLKYTVEFPKGEELDYKEE